MSDNVGSASLEMDLEMRYARAYRKAEQLRLHAFEVKTDRLYRVRSQRAGHPAHYIEVTEGGLVCDCESGRAGAPCVHAAAVARRREREGKCKQLFPAFETAAELFDGEDLEVIVELDDLPVAETHEKAPVALRPSEKYKLTDIWY